MNTSSNIKMEVQARGIQCLLEDEKFRSAVEQFVMRVNWRITQVKIDPRFYDILLSQDHIDWNPAKFILRKLTFLKVMIIDERMSEWEIVEQLKVNNPGMKVKKFEV